MAAVTETALSKGEIAQRVAVVRRFKELLIEQRERFRSYLAVLDKQQTLIGSGSADEILSHVELEEKIVSDIFSIQKVIDPLENMYRTALPYFPSDDVPVIKASLEDLKTQAIARSERNRNLLSDRMAEVRTEITALRNNPLTLNARRSSLQVNTASLVDIKG